MQLTPYGIRSAPFPQGRKGRVLLVGRNIDYGVLQSAVPDVVKRHSIANHDVSHTRGPDFWEQFFGNEDYADDYSNRRIPDVIITSGWGRQYTPDGSGMEVNMLAWLEIVAAEWGIPLEVEQ